MDKLVQSLGITGLSRSQVSEMAKDLDAQVEAFRTRPLDAGPYTFVAADALTMKVREDGRVVNVAVLVATGVNGDGHREVLGVQVTTAETGAGWLAFFRDLVARGLSGVALVTSDAHAGLVAAIGATLPGATWQRCRTHYAANLMSACPEVLVAGGEGDAAQRLRPARRRRRCTPSTTSSSTPSPTSCPPSHDHLDAARADVLAFTTFPRELWRQIWSNNPNERLNREIRRRTDVVGIFPDRDAVIRLVGAVLAEQHDEWAEGRRYLGLDILGRSRLTLVPAPSTQTPPQPQPPTRRPPSPPNDTPDEGITSYTTRRDLTHHRSAKPLHLRRLDSAHRTPGDHPVRVPSRQPTGYG